MNIAISLSSLSRKISFLFVAVSLIYFLALAIVSSLKGSGVVFWFCLQNSIVDCICSNTESGNSLSISIAIFSRLERYFKVFFIGQPSLVYYNIKIDEES
ncbi:hypothetical protein [Helicobacter typhlonius]|uniref:hypothetical protein n=1 Tax=Helicobacter typhlonius TaxID=76936 RepID=UPI00260D41F8|nr:hypothetical protein [uncultured Helicobacter sp.]